MDHARSSSGIFFERRMISLTQEEISCSASTIGEMSGGQSATHTLSRSCEMALRAKTWVALLASRLT